MNYKIPLQPDLHIASVNAQPFKILNLYAGLGGNRKKWTGNIQVTAVEIDPKIAAVYKANNPDDIVIVGDAHQYLKEHYKEFDGCWTSPPCQKESMMMKATRHDVADYISVELYQEIIFLKHFFKGKWWIVENVKPYYEPLIPPTKILGRHYLWANFEIGDFEMPNFKGFITAGTSTETEKLKEWLGIKYEGNIYYKGNHCPGQVLRNCVHPDFGLHILNAAMSVKQSKQQHSIKEPTLF